MSARESEPSKGRWILLALLPLALLALLLFAIVRFGPATAVRGNAPPVEVLAFQKVVLAGDGIHLTVVNDGPDPVVIAQVLVDEAFWKFTIDPEDGALSHLERARIHIPYPWVHGEAHELRLLSRNGVTFDHTIDVAVLTPKASARSLGVFSLIGLYVGVLPVALGLLWFPVISRLSRRGLDFVLALTVGLLAFLFLDTGHEGAEAAAALPQSFQGLALLAFSALLAFLAVEALGSSLRGRGPSSDGSWVMALLVAIGIGLHNLAEGLAIGAAFAIGEVGLGTLLILGFTLHNTTEGLAIVAPLARQRARIPRLIGLGVIAGAPTILGAWLGGVVQSPVASVIFLGLGVGAIAQVVWQISRAAAGDRPLGGFLRSGPVVAGLFVGLAIMYATGLMVG